MWNTTANASGWNLNSEGDPPFTSPFPLESRQAESGDETGPSILLIEDSEADALLVQHALRENDVKANLQVLRDGEEAFQFVEAVEKGLVDCPELVLLDLNLPKKSGHEVLAKMRKSDACHDVPVVILSSSSTNADVSESKRLNVTRHIQKPLELEEFLKIGAIVKALLANRII